MACRARLDGLAISMRTGCPAVPSQEWRLTRMVNGERVTVKKKVLVHHFPMGDVEDPYLYAAQPLWEWQKTNMGQWVMENAVDEPTFYCHPDPLNFGYRIEIYATLQGESLTYFELKYGGNKRP